MALTECTETREAFIAAFIDRELDGKRECPNCGADEWDCEDARAAEYGQRACGPTVYCQCCTTTWERCGISWCRWAD